MTDETPPTTAEEKKPEEPKVVTDAKTAREELMKENDRLEKNIAELKELKATETLGGQTDAGEQPEKPKEETPQDYAKDVIAGKHNDKPKTD